MTLSAGSNGPVLPQRAHDAHRFQGDEPSWYLVTTDDRMIPPPAQRFMSKRAGSTVVEVNGSHAVYVSKPEEVAALIRKAAAGIRKAD